MATYGSSGPLRAYFQGGAGEGRSVGDLFDVAGKAIACA